MAKNIQTDSSPLRAIGKELGVVGATPTNLFDFISRTGDTNLRNEAVSSGIPSFLDRQLSLNDADLQKEIAARLRTSGPATFRNLRDIIGTQGLANIQEQFGLNNIPSNILPVQNVLNNKDSITTTGNTPSDFLTGIRKSLSESLTPEGEIRNKLVRQQNLEQASLPIEQELATRRLANQKNQQGSGLIERIAGVGSNFLDSIFSKSQSQPASINSVVDIPETGETINLDEEDIDSQITKLVRDADLAIAQGRNRDLVNRRLQTLIQELEARRK